LAGLLLFSIYLEAYQRVDRTKEAEDLRRGRLVWLSTTMARIYSPKDAKMDFGRTIDSESVMETYWHSENSGDSLRKNWKRNGYRFIAFHTCKYHGIITKGLH
jgi:hypothetical protein